MEENKNIVNERKTSNIVFNIILGVLILVVFVFGAFIFYDKKLKNENLTNKNEENIVVDDTKYEDEIIVDASTVTQPLMDAYIKELTNFNMKADYSKTDQAYTKLINKEADLIIVTSPSEDEIQRAKDAGVEFSIIPVVNEAFVFYTNINNETNSLKLEEVQKIYTGEITNWKEVGGQDASIIAYQRPANSGSQTGMLTLVMKDLKMKEPTKTEYIDTMAGIIDVVSNYENGKDAIGYSYYYYATTMYGNSKMKFFAINGVAPTHDSIKEETYPLITSYYIVTLKENQKESVLKLKDVMLSSKGQTIAKNAGYVERS